MPVRAVGRGAIPGARAGHPAALGRHPALARVGRDDDEDRGRDRPVARGFRPVAAGRILGQRGPALGRSQRPGGTSDDLPDRHQSHGRRGHRRAGRPDREPPSDPLPGGQADPCRSPRHRSPLDAGPGGHRGRQPAHGLRQHRRRDQRRPLPPARAGGRGPAAAARLACLLQGRGLHARVRSPGRARRGLRGRRRADRGLHRMLVRDPGAGDLLRNRGDQPRRRPERPAGDRRRAPAGDRSAREHGWPPSSAAIRSAPLLRGAGDRRLSAPRSRRPSSGSGRIGRLRGAADPRGVRRSSSRGHSATSPSRWPAIPGS